MRALTAAPSALEVTRVDARTLLVRLEPRTLQHAPFSRYHRAEELRFAVGDRIELTGFTVEILGLNAAGDPNELAYRFRVPLEDASLRWPRVARRPLRAWRPPAPGETRAPLARGTGARSSAGRASAYFSSFRPYPRIVRAMIRCWIWPVPS